MATNEPTMGHPPNKTDIATEVQGSSILAYYTQGKALLSQRRNNTSYFYHYDGLGSTKALTDANQNIQNTTKYDAWGNILQSSGTITNPYLYVGELGYYGDGDAGMYLLTQRWYNPVIGRFMIKDPLGEKEEIISFKREVVPYLYTKNNPLNAVDPDGLFTRWHCYKWFYDCLKDAREEYERCIKYITGSGEEISIGCEILCELVCFPAEAIGGLAAHIGCTLVCRPFCKPLITGIAVKPCSELRNIMEQRCRDAFRWCMKHADCP
jgi:RHS repeat-associated protein